MKASELRNLIREEIKRALYEAAKTEYNYTNPQVDAAVVKDVMKELKKLSPKLLKATRDDFSFMTFNLPDGPEVRVSMTVVTIHAQDLPTPVDAAPDWSYQFAITATLANGHTITLQTGTLTLRRAR